MWLVIEYERLVGALNHIRAHLTDGGQDARGSSPWPEWNGTKVNAMAQERL